MKSALLKRSLLTLALMLTLVTGGNAQQPANRHTGPLDSSLPTTYLEAKRDPFRNEGTTGPVTPPPVKHQKLPIPWPSYQEREQQWKEQRDQARKTSQPSPSPAARYLISEIEIVGLFKKPEANGVFIKPKQVASTTLFVTVGEQFYNGRIKKISGNQIEFEEITKFNDGSEQTAPQVITYNSKR